MSSQEALSEEHKYTNKLIETTSPYLLQHAHNPVNWYPWGKEALEKARKEDKPILVSIGYSTCYWCHVMEREVFENPEIAKIMNDNFICIKVDREERPDLDEIYMTATQVITRHGGWPNNIFITPELKPFFAGTYFGAEDKFGRPGFPTVLERLTDLWQNHRSDVLDNADNISNQIIAITSGNNKTVEINSLYLIKQTVSHLKQFDDPRDGGFYQAPKFPHETYLDFLLAYYNKYNDSDVIEIVENTLSKMAAGGLHEQIAGGFHRYSTDAQWQIPHYEKMLYNQALLANNYSDLYAISNNPYYKDVVEGIFAFVDRILTHDDGAFYSALDAETDAVEGAYYAWTEDELAKILSSKELKLFNKVYNLAEIPEIAGHKHTDAKTPYAKKAPLEIAIGLGITYEELAETLKPIHKKLLKVQADRKLPVLDTKIITAWNGLMIDAYANAGVILDEKKYIKKAEKAAKFILNNMKTDDGGLYRIWSDGKTHINGFLEDYSFFIKGLLSIYRANEDGKLLQEAINLAKKVEELFSDGEGGYYFSDGSEELLTRIKQGDDSAIPSGNSVLIHGFIDLYEITGDEAWRNKASDLINSLSYRMTRNPSQFTHSIHALMRLSDTKSKKVAKKIEGEPDSLDSKSKVAVFAKFTKENEILVRLLVKDGWHINSNKPSLDFLIATSIDVRGNKAEIIEATYPPPTLLDSPLDDKKISVFEGDIVIKLRIKYDSAQGEEDFRVLTRFQACKDTTCLKPSDTVTKLAY